jgi:UDP-N-acetylmuramyl pentapeptide phosphotransferase/UDP-N-acetylglucosamine-1-phosphate transferase
MTGGIAVAAGVAALLSAMATAALLRWQRHLPHAAVTGRSLHATPMPRVGGLAIWCGTVPVTLASAPTPSLAWQVVAVPWLALVLVSLADDMKAVPIAPRLAVHAGAAVWLAVALDRSTGGALPVALVAFHALAIAWSLNLYNFMDGSDGLAAAMTVAGFGAYAAVLVHAGLPAMLPLAIAAATLPVLAVNRPPARMFLGDVGAVPLGFLASAIGIAGIVDGAWEAWFPLLVFLPFVADATVTLARRALRGERIWEAHKSHYYQRLLQLGAGHAGTLAVFGATMLGTAISAVVCQIVAPAWGTLALAAWCAIQGLLFAAIDYHWKRRPGHT